MRVGIAFPSDFACSLPSWSCNSARQSRHKNLKFGWDMCVSVWEGKCFFDSFASDLQFHVGGWGSYRLLADNLFPHVAENIACFT